MNTRRRSPSLADSLALAAELERRKAARPGNPMRKALQTASAYDRLALQARTFSP